VLAPLVLALLTAVDVTARPQDTRCPSRLALSAALDGRVPDQAEQWSLRYRVEARNAGTRDNRVWLELRDEDGDLKLRRELTIADDGCEAAADGIALIVARFFREVQWTGAVPLPDMQRKPEPPPPPPVRPGRPWELEAGPTLRRAAALAPGLSLATRIPFGQRWLVSAGLTVEVPVSRTEGKGSMTLWSVPLRGSVRRLVARGSLAFDGGPQVTAAYEHAALSLPFEDRSRLVVSAGGVASARWGFAPQWSFGLELAVEVTAYGPDIAPLQFPGLVPTPHRVQLFGLGGVARAF
jgi:hypothetical protein